MTPPISPIPSSPHGFYSQIHSNDEALSQNLQETLKKIVDQLNSIKNHVEVEHLDPRSLAEDLEGYDRHHTDFLRELNKNSNRGFEKTVKDKFEVMHHRFTDELNDITDVHGTSLRDTLSLYDSKKLTLFLDNLNKAPHSKGSLHKLGDLAGVFAQEISSTFKLYPS